MARKCRVDYENAMHHIVVKAINSQYIFNEKEVKDTFIAKLKKYKLVYNVKIIAYCLMDNHIHLFIQSGKSKDDQHLCISEFMRDLLATFARWFNKKTGRTGPLFNGRFKSFLCESIPYLIYLIDYIHRNPYEAKITNSYQYAYSSYNDYTDRGEGICDLSTCFDAFNLTKDDVLRYLNERMYTNNLPVMNALLEKIRHAKVGEAISKILIDYGFKVDSLRGSCNADYLKIVRNKIIVELHRVRKQSIDSLASYFDIHKNQVARILNASKKDKKRNSSYVRSFP